MRQTHDGAAGLGEYLSRAQVAVFFNVSTSTITRWAEEGKLTHVRTLGGHRRYLTEEVLQLVRTLTKETRMETLILEIPSLYGDHHVIALHKLLGQFTGIQAVQVSAAAHELTLTFDPAVAPAATLLDRLAAAGFPARDHLAQNGHARGKKDPAWAALGLRMTQTHPADR